ncbi:MAG TPA: tRNA lysidine(34) synthetase TilS [Terriglobales bacterium]|nr:tRNA lysidine(34) synthetase TilS [Terriglobales bacterium]
MRQHALDALATGHTLDDQAETVLMRLLRGAGTRGLAGILPRKRVAPAEPQPRHVVRPLLAVRRSEVHEYLRSLRQDFRDDASNRDPKFLRNRIRGELLPLLARDYNPQVAEALAQTAEIARAEQQHWERAVSEAWRELARWKAAPGQGRGVILDGAALGRMEAALQRQLLQHACERSGSSPSFEQIEAVRELAAKRSGTVELPGGVRAIRDGDELRVWVEEAPAGHARDRRRDAGATNYAYPLEVPGGVRVPELNIQISATDAAAGRATGFVVRNWRAGDRFHPRHSKGPKKVKELLTEKKITGRERELWPVVAAGERIVWLRGWGMAADAAGAGGAEGLRIEEADFAK